MLVINKKIKNRFKKEQNMKLKSNFNKIEKGQQFKKDNPNKKYEGKILKGINKELELMQSKIDDKIDGG